MLDHRLSFSLAMMLLLSSTDVIPAEATNNKTAVFYVCNLCGVVPLVVSSVDNNLYAVVNANTFDDQASFTFSSSATDFDGEETDDRLERRKRNWINQVEISVDSH